MGHHIVMGRKTYESIGRPLPGRTSIVVSRQQQLFPTANVKYAESLDQAVAMAGDDPEVFVIGGGELFAEALPQADKAYVTWVYADLEGDTYFPEFPTSAWKQLSDEYIPQDDKNEFPTRFRIYQRI